MVSRFACEGRTALLYQSIKVDFFEKKAHIRLSVTNLFVYLYVIINAGDVRISSLHYGTIVQSYL